MSGTGVENIQGDAQKRTPAPASMSFTKRRKILREKFMEDLRQEEAAAAAASGSARAEKPIPDHSAIDRYLLELKEQQENLIEGIGIPRTYKYDPHTPLPMKREDILPSTLKMCKGFGPSTLEWCKEYAQIAYVTKHSSQ